MQTPSVPQSLDTRTLAALQAMLLKALERYPDEAARMQRGYALAAQGHVTLHEDGSASVQSGTWSDTYYHVGKECVCADWSKAPGGRCKHRFGKVLLQRAYDHLHRPSVATADPQTPYAFPQYTTFAATYVRPGPYQGHNGTAVKRLNGFLFTPDSNPHLDLPCAYADVALGPGLA